MSIPIPGDFSKKICEIFGVDHLLVKSISIDADPDAIVTATFVVAVDGHCADALIQDLKDRPITA